MIDKLKKLFHATTKPIEKTSVSESALNVLLCDVDVNESCDYYGIPLGNGEYYMQRKHQLSGSDSPLDSGEKVIVKLCKTLISTKGLLDTLNIKYGT